MQTIILRPSILGQKLAKALAFVNVRNALINFCDDCFFRCLSIRKNQGDRRLCSSAG